jgi:nicotinate-nucleotide adenylyltransferase
MTRRRRTRIGILGGTFNPIHLGHLLIAQDAVEAAKLDRVLFIPTANPPHKPLAGNTDARHRLRMVKLAIDGDQRFAADGLEIRRGGKSYSVDTLAQLRERFPSADFYFILGADSLDELHLWKEARRLVKLCRFLAVTRPGYKGHPSRLPGLRYQLLNVHPCGIASREIRERVARGSSIRYLVPEPVVRYIQRHKLYQ